MLVQPNVLQQDGRIPAPLECYVKCPTTLNFLTIMRYIDQTTRKMIKGFYFEVKLVKLISMFDIFLRILGN